MANVTGAAAGGGGMFISMAWDSMGVIDPGRRGSSYFLPIATPKKRGRPGLFEEVEEKKAESNHVNSIRQLVKKWRDLGWPDVTPATRALLDHWHADDRFRPLFFCQIEALETLIFIIEVAKQTSWTPSRADACGSR